MIVDSSAIVAILRAEPEAQAFSTEIGESIDAKLSAASYLEVGIVIDSSRDPVASREIDALLQTLEIAIEPVTESQARLAREAFRDFGKGSGHPACLNFGDCFSYALAKEKGEPLLYKGNDFRHTDVQRVLP